MIDYSDIILEANQGNPIQMYELAQLYNMGILPSDGEKYVFWLEKFWNTEEVQNILLYYDDVEDVHVGPMDTMLYRPYIVEAGLCLGMYYQNSSRIDELMKALEYFGGACIVNRFYYIELECDGEETTVLSLIGKVNDRLKEMGVSFEGE